MCNGVQNVQKGVKPTHYEQKRAETRLKPVGSLNPVLVREAEVYTRVGTVIHRLEQKWEV